MFQGCGNSSEQLITKQARMRVAFLLLCLLYTTSSYVPRRRSPLKVHVATFASSTLQAIKTAPFEDIIPFLSEHVQPTDQLLFVGAGTDLSLQMLRAGYGGAKDSSPGCMTIIDSDASAIKELTEMALQDPLIKARIDMGKVTIEAVDLMNMPSVCLQSAYDSVVDYGALDALLVGSGKVSFLQCVDHLQDAVRLGNILVCLSTLDKKAFCAPFEERLGWVQELDGDPGEISAWYRGKTNIAATKSNFDRYGLKMYVYTNTDNC